MDNGFYNEIEDSVTQTSASEAYTLEMFGVSAEDIIIGIVKKHTEIDTVTPDSRLKYDLGLDSLKMMEICIDIEDAFNIFSSKATGAVETVGDIIRLIDNCDTMTCNVGYDINDYPIKKTLKQVKWLNRFTKLTRVIYKLNACGVEHVSAKNNYIYCSNHTSTFDGLWILSVLGFSRVDPNRLCSLAKHEFLHKKATRFGMTLLGCIPVDRSGNTIPAVKRCIECLKSEDYSLIIHPEGTVSRDGKINEFKSGVAKISIDTGIEIIPIRIEGAVAKVKNGLAIPKTMNWKKLRRHEITIHFGKPISPKGRNVDELIRAVRVAVKDLGNDQK